MHFCKPSFNAVKSLLESADLPVDDLPKDLEHFLGCGDPANPDGVVGLEIYGDVALLRSLAVAKAGRGRGLGTRLVALIEEYANEQDVRTIFLLTETAEQFFASLGYEAISRESAPDSIQATKEFSELCPADAAFMAKDPG